MRFLSNILCLGLSATAAQSANSLPPMPAGPNCHVLQTAISVDGGMTYKVRGVNLQDAVSVPDVVRFQDRTLMYYVDGDFDKHRITVAEIPAKANSVKDIGPITLDGDIIKDAVDPDVVVTPDGKLRLYYYVGQFTQPISGAKPNKIYTAVSNDGVNFKVDGVAAKVDGGTDPTVVRLQNGTYLLAVAKGEEQKIALFSSKDGRKFRPLTELRGGIPELALAENGDAELIYQDAEGFVRLVSSDDGKSWTSSSANLVRGDTKGAASPGVAALDGQNRIMVYFKTKSGCTTPPTAYFGTPAGGAMTGGGQMPPPPLGNGVAPSSGSAKGPPPLGHGVTPPSN